MLSFPTPSSHDTSACFVTYGTMGHPDPKQTPTKGKPWNTLLAQSFIRSVDLIVPKESMIRLQERLASGEWSPIYQSLIMQLGDVLEGDFFTQYIKTGDIRMVSEGRVDTDDVFTIINGTLTLYLGKETYERAGLIGQPFGVKGRRGLRPRWVVQYDLRSPASSSGRKGFDRLVYACKHALNQPVNWLFVCLSKRPSPDPLSKHSPIKFTSPPLVSEGIQVRMPNLKPPQDSAGAGSRTALEAFAIEVYEWLSLFRLQSPRIDSNDNIDPYLARYDVPGSQDGLQEATLYKISWQGFLGSSWAHQILVDIILATSSCSWFSLSVTALGKGTSGESSDCTILRPPSSPGKYILWDIYSHNA